MVAGNDLVIKDIRLEDRGPFMCRGENHLGHVYALIVLVVKPVGKWTKYFREKLKLAWQIKKHKSNEILSIFIYCLNL